MGDVNLDGEVNISDATLIQKYLVDLVPLSDNALSLADFNKDSFVNISDVTLIQKYIAASSNN